MKVQREHEFRLNLCFACAKRVYCKRILNWVTSAHALCCQWLNRAAWLKCRPLAVADITTPPDRLTDRQTDRQTDSPTADHTRHQVQQLDPTSVIYVWLCA